jgi:hypothetical protein
MGLEVSQGDRVPALYSRIFGESAPYPGISRPRCHLGSADEAVQRLQMRNMELVKTWKVPSLIVSYEKSIQSPEQFISDLCQFIGVEKPADTSAIRAFMEPGEYKPI